IFALRVALLTARHQIAFGRFAAANDRHQMIHGQLLRREAPAAMMADPGRALALPPRAGAQLARLLPLAANLLLGDFDQKGRRFQRGHFSLYSRPRFLKYTAKPTATIQYRPARAMAQIAAGKIIAQFPGREKAEKQ